MIVLSSLTFTVLALRLAWFDLRERAMPTGLLDALIGLGLLTAAVSEASTQTGFSTSLHDSVIGLCAGYVSLWLIHALYRALRRHDGLGYADLKLAAALGAWFGWLALPSLFAVAGIFAVGFGVVRKQQGEALPFGSGLALAGSGWLGWHVAVG